MKLYEVIENTRILHNGKAYSKGEQLKLTNDEAANLGIFVKEVKADPSVDVKPDTEPELKQEPQPVAEPKATTSTKSRTTKAST